ncbi:MAG: hypothetical protein FWF23_02935, partial [Alphaproteobacteria bacterium]|nr:hypothetical protein [Alphaproteobacteria bacterium]
MTDEQETRLDENISEEETLNFQQDSDMRPPEQDSDIRHQEEVELPFVEYDLNEEPPEMEVQQQPAATPGRQRSPALPITAAAIAVIILGSVAWVKFSGNEMVSKDLSGISAPMPDITLPASEIREKEVLAVASPDNGNVAVYTADMAELALPVAEIKDIREAPAAPAAVIAEAMPTNVIPIPEKAEALVALPAESTETSVKEASSIIKDEVVPAETAPAVAADVDMLKAKVSSLEEKIAALE